MPILPTYTQDIPTTISVDGGTFGFLDFGDGVFGEGEYENEFTPAYSVAGGYGSGKFGEKQFGVGGAGRYVITYTME